MKKRATGIAGIALLLLTTACTNKDQFTLEGTFDNGANKTLYLEELTPDGPVFIDSIHLDKNGHFSRKQTMAYETFYNLHTTEAANDYVVLLPKAGETITLTGDVRSLQWSYDVTGSHGSQLLWQIQDFSNTGITTLTEIIEQDNQNRQKYGSDTAGYNQARKTTDSLYRDARQGMIGYMSKFICDNEGSLATIIALYKQFNQSAIITPEANFDYYELVLEGLERDNGDNPHTIHFKNEVERLRQHYGQPKEALDMVFDGQ